MKKTTRYLRNQGGSTMLIALIFMVLLTLIGLVAANTSTLETMIASADAKKRGAFHAAEAGVDHVIAVLRPLFITNNQSQLATRIAQGSSAGNLSWSFALNGTAGVNSATTPATNSGWRGKFDAGAPWITDYNLGNGYSYSVRVWNNNNDGGDTISDNDATVIIGALATGPSNTRAAIEVSLFGNLTNISPAITYTAQAGGGSGKNYNASDVGAISDTNIQAMVSAGSP